MFMDTPTQIKLVEEKFELKKSPNFVNITSAGIGTIAKINPAIEASSNLNLIFLILHYHLFQIQLNILHLK